MDLEGELPYSGPRTFSVSDLQHGNGDALSYGKKSKEILTCDVFSLILSCGFFSACNFASFSCSKIIDTKLHHIYART